MRDLKAQFRQSYLGYLWLLAPALMTTGVWLFLNRSQVVMVADTGMPYPIFVLIGTIFWQSFANGIMAPLNSFNGGRSVFMKLKVPPEAFILAGGARTLFDFLISLLLILPVFLYYQVLPAPTVILLPVVVFASYLMSAAIGMILVPIGSLYQDVAQAVGLGLRFAMFFVPVVYPIPKTGWLATAMWWNPFTPILQTARDWLMFGTTDAWPGLLIGLPVSLTVLFLGFIILRVTMPHLVARMGM
jgi:lipopolysaccharide transport system permease protein